MFLAVLIDLLRFLKNLFKAHFILQQHRRALKLVGLRRIVFVLSIGIVVAVVFVKFCFLNFLNAPGYSIVISIRIYNSI